MVDLSGELHKHHHSPADRDPDVGGPGTTPARRRVLVINRTVRTGSSATRPPDR